MLRQSIALFAACSLALFAFSCPLSAREEKGELQSELDKLHQELEQYTQKLNQTGTRRKEQRQKLDDAREQENSILSLLEKYERLIKSSRRRLRRHRTQKKAALKKLRKTTEELEAVQSKLGKRESLLADRLRGIYKRGTFVQPRVTLGAASMSDLVTRHRYYKEIVKYDRSVIGNYRKTKDKLENLREDRREILKKRRRLTQKIQTSLANLKEARKRRKKVLQEVRDRKDFYRKKIEELESRRKRLKQIVVELQQEKSMTETRLQRLTHRFGRRKGELPWPVESREILHPFGSWEDGKVTRENDGVDIKVSEGARVRSVAPGRVVFAREYQGMGKVVILRHSGKYLTLYGSLIKLDVENGDEVARGDSLGRAGHSVAADEPHLYFQVFKGKEILNPMNWLK